MRGRLLIFLAVICFCFLPLSCLKAEEPKEGEKNQVQERVFPEPKPEESKSAEPEATETEISEVESLEEGQLQEPPIETQSEEMVPLVTEVMSDEEFQAYLIEKRIPMITEEDFKEPELVWEKTFDVPVEEISDLTEKGNSIVLSSTKFYTEKSDMKALLFIDGDGHIRKTVKVEDVGKKIAHLLYVPKSGRFAGIYKIDRKKMKTNLTYYDEEGNLLWSKDMDGEIWPDEIPIIISHSGEVIAVASGNPRWSLEEETIGVDLNINKLKFYNARGDLLSEYSGFLKMSIGKLSDDGKYFVGILWWSKGIDMSENKLVYIRTEDGEVLWERPFPGYYNIDYGEEYDLAISEKGTYVAAVKLGTDNFRGADAEVHVFGKKGKLVKRIKSSGVYNIYENGFVSARYLVDISMPKFVGRFFLPVKSDIELWEDPKAIIREDYPAFTSRDGRFLKIVDHRGNRVKISKFSIRRQ